ncbi:hypothetical protein OOZ15_01140 [Galbibacter sp. EGI 63066]|uniref:hypothetical protein n=1 Tax=Galbibacter sp. EGI 63066 TaxID=2993559 RepID=UPI002248D829|nr:hypothetical protein [Galbibacter sp. EGI 63066]MCX2678535.1 hypothetical protein [Galbibacter sp. EGI 63066]
MASVNNIEKLLEKYFEATTTVAEENELRVYFSQSEVAPHLEQYRPMFAYFSVAKKEKSTRDVPLKPRRNTNYLKWISVAAVAAIIFGVYINRPAEVSPLEETYTQEELQSARMALALFTDNFNKGTQGAAHLAEFEKNTNRFLINE